MFIRNLDTHLVLFNLFMPSKLQMFRAAFKNIS